MLVWLAASPAAANGPLPAEAPPAPIFASNAPPGVTNPSLSAVDLQRSFDGLISYGLFQGDIAGGEVAVVQNGRVVFEKGYGFADVAKRKSVSAETTLFRMGSVSKLLTWTAVMQLVQAHKLDLDRDVNDYLDFKIPPAFGAPITLRNLMTHTPGFDETFKNLGFHDGKAAPSIRKLVRDDIPARIFPPGAVVAYSNYGATLAGYIVQRVSGEPFAEYVRRHIFLPLGMTHSTFEQRIPLPLASNLSRGYRTASDPAEPFEWVAMLPAGGLSSTASDMARFMIAHLQNGRLDNVEVLDKATAQLMHSHQRTEAPGVNGFALGFYEESRGDHRIIGHSGDTQFFHSDLHLILDAGTGLFMSFNSRGSNDATYKLRTALFHEFMNRYFPVAPVKSMAMPTAVQDAKSVVGTYISSDRQERSIFRFLTLLDQSEVSADDRGELQVSSLTGIDGAPYRWREIGLSLYAQINGPSRLAVVRNRNGAVDHIAWGGDPTFVLEPAPIGESGSVMLLLGMSAAVLLISVLIWPVAALVRLRYGRRDELSQRARVLRLLARLGAVAWLLTVGGWIALLMSIQSNLTLLSSTITPALMLLYVLGVVSLIGSVFVIINAVETWREAGRSNFVRAGQTVSMVATAFLAWFVISYHLVSFMTQF